MQRQVALVAADPQSTPQATAWAEMIRAAIRARRDVCKHCLRPYDAWEPTQGQRFQLRAILNIPDHELDPKLCKACHDRSIETYNPRYTMPGTSNAGPPNLVLIDKYTHASKNHG